MSFLAVKEDQGPILLQFIEEVVKEGALPLPPEDPR
jgi:hypothetical protein